MVLGSLLVERALASEAGKVLRWRGVGGWGGQYSPGGAGAVPPAISGKQISWAMAGMTQMETKKPSIFGQRAQRGPDPQPAQAGSPTPSLPPYLPLGP